MSDDAITSEFHDPDEGDAAPLLFAEVANIKQRTFLTALSGCGQTRLAAAAARISRSSVYRWLRIDGKFAELYCEAQRIACDVLTEAAFERAYVGVERYKFDRDGVRHTELHYSDVLLIFLLKKLDPKRFGDKSDELQEAGEQKITVEFVDDYSDNSNYQAHLTANDGPADEAA